MPPLWNPSPASQGMLYTTIGSVSFAISFSLVIQINKIIMVMKKEMRGENKIIVEK